MIELHRVYEHSRTHGTRFLVERLWPRGVRKESLHFTDWLKDVGGALIDSDPGMGDVAVRGGLGGVVRGTHVGRSGAICPNAYFP